MSSSRCALPLSLAAIPDPCWQVLIPSSKLAWECQQSLRCTPNHWDCARVKRPQQPWGGGWEEGFWAERGRMLCVMCC